MHPSRAEFIKNEQKQPSDQAQSAGLTLPLSFGSTSNHREGKKRIKYDNNVQRGTRGNSERGRGRGQYRGRGGSYPVSQHHHHHQNVSQDLQRGEQDDGRFTIDTKGNHHQEEGYYDKRWLEDPWKSFLLEASPLATREAEGKDLVLSRGK